MDADNHPEPPSHHRRDESATESIPSPHGTGDPRQTWGQDISQAQWWTLLPSTGVAPQTAHAQPASFQHMLEHQNQNIPLPQQPVSPRSHQPQYSTSFQSYFGPPMSSMPQSAQSSTSSMAVDPRIAFPPSQHFQHQPQSPRQLHFQTSHAQVDDPTSSGITRSHSNSTVATSPFAQPFYPTTWTNFSVSQPGRINGYTTTINPDTLTSNSPQAFHNHHRLSARERRATDSRIVTGVKSPQSPHSSHATGSSSSKHESPGHGSMYDGLSSSFTTSPTTSPKRHRRRNSHAAMDNEEVRLREMEKDLAMAEFDAGPNRGNKRERRKMQNRLAQKAFRARTKVIAGEEAERVLTLESQSREQSEQIERMTALVDRLQHENQILRNAWPQMTSPPTMSRPDGVSASPSGSSDDLHVVPSDVTTASGMGLGLSPSQWQMVPEVSHSPGDKFAGPDGDSSMPE